MSNQDKERYYLKYLKTYIEDEEQSQMMYKIMELQPHKSRDYTYDDIGTSQLVASVCTDIRYCEDLKCWYRWNGCVWERDISGSRVTTCITTLFNLLRHYCKEMEKEWNVNSGEAKIKEASKEKVLYRKKLEEAEAAKMHNVNDAK